MKRVAIGAHLHREDVEPEAEATAAGDLWISGLAVADDQPLGDRALLLRVASVRARLLEKATFIAIRYGWAFTSDSEAAEKVAARAGEWKRLLTEYRPLCEMTLKIVADNAGPRPDRRDFASGADYLRALHDAAHAATIDDRFRKDIERTLVPLAQRHRWIHRHDSAIELVMLVQRSAVDEVKRAGEALKESAAGAPFLLSGPWPLEVFAE